MKRIPLTQGQFVLVDDADCEWLSRWKWYAHWARCTRSFYALRGEFNGKNMRTVSMHREILGLKFGDRQQTDHVDHDTLNNQRQNLHTVTRAQNQWNRRNTKGYHHRQSDGKYGASIQFLGKTIYIGLFDSPGEARRAYLSTKAVLHSIPKEIR